MSRALFKKQMLEVFSWLFRSKKTRKNRSKKGIIIYGILYLFLLIFLVGIFFLVASMLCEPLVSAHLGWMYFAIMGLISVALGVFGSVFNTYASLYQAKDNDFLLSMPIPSGKILQIRLFGVFIMGLVYELIVMIPAVIVYFMCADAGLLGIICTLLIPFVLSVFVLTLSCILGWVVALISSRLKNKNIIAVLLSVVFIIVYYYFYAQAYTMLRNILVNAQIMEDKIKIILYPLYHMGLAAEGKVISMLIFVLIIAGLFAIVYWILARSFFKIATLNRGGTKTKYRERTVKAGTADSALIYKEFRRFLGSSNYMLNCGFGILFMIIAAVALLIKGNAVLQMMDLLLGDYPDLIYLIAAAAVCMLASMNDMTAVSVSLEGKNLWLVQSFPVSGRQALLAKLKMQLWLTLLPAVILVICVEWVLKPPVIFAVLILLVAAAYILFMAVFGLFMNLKVPNLHWTNEIVPIKQSMSVSIVLLGGWVVVVILAVVYYLLIDFVSPMAFMIGSAAVLLIAFGVFLRWILTKGAVIFISIL